MTALHAAWRSVQSRWCVSFEDFERLTTGWDVHPVTLGGEPVGAVLVKGPHIHACIAEGYGRWFGRSHIRLLNDVIEKHGYAETSATTPAGLEFVERLGFEKFGTAFRRYEPWALKQR